MAGLAFALASSMAHLAAAFAWKGHGVSEDKVSKQKDTKRANWGVGLAVRFTMSILPGLLLPSERALGLVIRSTDTESRYYGVRIQRTGTLTGMGRDQTYDTKHLLVMVHSIEHSLFGIASLTFSSSIQIRVGRSQQSHSAAMSSATLRGRSACIEWWK